MKAKNLQTQNKKILHYLETHKRGITNVDAAEKFHCYRLSGRIFDLRQMGYDIETYYEQHENEDGSRSRYARYFLK